MSDGYYAAADPNPTHGEECRKQRQNSEDPCACPPETQQEIADRLNREFAALYNGSGPALFLDRDTHEQEVDDATEIAERPEAFTDDQRRCALRVLLQDARGLQGARAEISRLNEHVADMARRLEHRAATVGVGDVVTLASESGSENVEGRDLPVATLRKV